MRILVFTATLLALILLSNIIWHSKKHIGLKILKGLGILFAILMLGLYSIIDDSFGASTPVNIKAENQTEENLRIYTIAFWRGNWEGNFVTYGNEIKPFEKSDFWFENDGTEEFWVVGKNKNEEIKFLKVVSEKRTEFNFVITAEKQIEASQIWIAKDMTFRKDKSLSMEKYAKLTIYVLIGLLLLSLLKDIKVWLQHKP